MTALKTEKDLALEAIRGLAAIVVLVWHLGLGFFPAAMGMFARYDEGLTGSPVFVLMNGRAAVAVFFVLSGYVLTRRYFLTGDWRIIFKGAVKRWPRLALPVFTVVILSYLLFDFDLYAFEEAGAASGSPWLMQFAGAYQGSPPSRTFLDALTQGAFLTLFRGDSRFDSALWTMHPELIGSFIAYGSASILFYTRRISHWLVVALILIGVLLAHFGNQDLVAFPVGIGLAALLPHGVHMRRALVLALIVSSLYLLGYSGQWEGIYFPFWYIPVRFEYVAVIGAAMLIVAVESSPGVRSALSGRGARFLGELSFPLYLVHTLVICSAGAFVYLLWGVWAGVVVSILISVVASLPLMALNKWWLEQLNSGTDRMIARASITFPSPS